jgi:hypothetical protein
MSANYPGDNVHPLRWLVLLIAAGTAGGGIGTEIAAHRLLDTSRAAWLVKPFLYSSLPKAGGHTDWGNVLSMAALFLVGLFLTLVAWHAPTKPAPAIRAGIGLILGGSLGQAATGLAFATSTHIVVVTRGDWGYAFSPFDLAIAIGTLLVLSEVVLPGSRILRDPAAAFQWRYLFGRSHRPR